MQVLEIDKLVELFTGLANGTSINELVSLEEVRPDQAEQITLITTMMPHVILAEELSLVTDLLREVSQVGPEFITSDELPEEAAKKERRLEEALRSKKGLVSIVTGKATTYPQITARQISDSLVQLAKSTRVK